MFSDCIFFKSLRYIVLDWIRGFFLILNPWVDFPLFVSRLKQNTIFYVCIIRNYDEKTVSFHHNRKGIPDLRKVRSTDLLSLHLHIFIFQSLHYILYSIIMWLLQVQIKWACYSESSLEKTFFFIYVAVNPVPCFVHSKWKSMNAVWMSKWIINKGLDGWTKNVYYL